MQQNRALMQKPALIFLSIHKRCERRPISIMKNALKLKAGYYFRARVHVFTRGAGEHNNKKTTLNRGNKPFSYNTAEKYVQLLAYKRTSIPTATSICKLKTAKGVGCINYYE